MDNKQGDYLRGQEIGKIMQGLKDLGRNVDSGFEDVQKEFDKLECRKHKEQISEVYLWYKDYKEIKKYTIKSIIKALVPALMFLGSFFGLAYAIIENG